MKTYEEIYLKNAEKIISCQLKKIYNIINNENSVITEFDFHLLCEDLKHLVHEYKHNRFFVDLMQLDESTYGRTYDREKYFRALCYAYGFVQEDI